MAVKSECTMGRAAVQSSCMMVRTAVLSVWTRMKYEAYTFIVIILLTITCVLASLPGRAGGCCTVLVDMSISMSQMSSTTSSQADTQGIVMTFYGFSLPSSPASSESSPQSSVDVCLDQPFSPTVCPKISSVKVTRYKWVGQPCTTGQRLSHAKK